VEAVDKQSIIRDLQKTANSSYINISEIAKSRRKGERWARNLVKGLEYFEEGRSKEFYIPDVAARMMESMRKF
jgi:hypothetical protein